MELPIWAHLLISGAAIAVVTAMVRALRPGKPPPLSAEGALAMFRGEFPVLQTASVEATPDGRTFLILSPTNGIVGCVTLVGLRWTARAIGFHDIVGVFLDGTQVTMRFRDFTWPTLSVDWRNADAARQWASRLGALQKAAHA
jgi:hypothetical protein